jgi:ketosteroid isomerase-like protein
MGIQDSPLRDRLVFLVGARRSGTNWLQRMVCAHPDTVAIPSETHLFSHGLAPLAARFQHGAVGSPKTARVYLPRDDAHDLLRDVADKVFGDLAAALAPGARLIVERTPWHVYHLDLIGAVYPDAHVVHIVRDGRDVARSLLSQEWGPTKMSEAAEEWRSAWAAAREHGPALAHFREVRYEDLLADPARRLPELYRWLGLDDRDEVVQLALVEAGVRFNTDPRRPEVGEGKWRSELSALEQRTFDRIAGPTLTSAGYERSTPSPAAGDLVRAGRFALRSALRSALRRARAAVRGRSASPPALPPGVPSTDRPFQEPGRSVARMEQIQDLLDAALAAFTDGDGARLRSLLAPDALVRTIASDTGATDDEGRDAAAHDRLADAVVAAARGRGPQRRGDVHPGEPLSAVVVAFGDAGGPLEVHTFVVSVAGDRVARLVWYRPGAP